MSSIKTTAIVLAGGQGTRMNNKVSKQYLLMENKPILYYSLQTFQDSFVDEIVLVVAQGEIAYCQKEIVDEYHLTKVKCIVEGGLQRYHSVYQGLEKLEDSDYVFIHDGARPFLNQDIIDRAYECVIKDKACVVGMPVKDTIKIADEHQYTKDTPNRDTVWMIQTPQVFSVPLIKGAYQTLLLHEKKLKQTITDDAMVVETFTNNKIKLIKGSYSNIKITTPEDMDVASALIKSMKF